MRLPRRTCLRCGRAESAPPECEGYQLCDDCFEEAEADGEDIEILEADLKTRVSKERGE